jgi:uncharacterized repeat protein (TIGR02543 family)
MALWFGSGIAVVSVLLGMIMVGSGLNLANTPVQGAESDYSITFDKDTNKLENEAFVSASGFFSGTDYMMTGLGSKITFEYDLFGQTTTIWQQIRRGGYFTNTDPIHGMKSITLQKSNFDSSFQIYWSENATFTEANSWTFGEGSTDLTRTCDFSGYSPNYIKVEAVGTGTNYIVSGSIVFSCADQYQTLRLTQNLAAAGTVKGGGIHKIGSSVALTATPNYGYKFVGWYHGTELLSTDASYTFTMPNCIGNYDVEARFWAYPFNLVLSSQDIEKGTVTGSGSYDCGSLVTISATAEKGYTFSGWYNHGGLVSSANPYSFAMHSSDLNYVAWFSVNSYVMTLTTDSVLGNAKGAGTYVYKGTVSLSATANSGYSFSGWYDGETLVSSANPYSFAMPYNDLSYTAKFTANQYTVSLSSSEVATTPVGTCEVSGAGTYAYGSNATISAVPAAGYGFLGWYDGDTLLSSNDSYTFVIPAKNVSYVAKYSKKYHVSVTSSDKAKGTVSGAGDFAYTSKVTVTGTCLGDYNGVIWYDDSFAPVSTDLSYTFAMPEADVNLSADFLKALGSSFTLGKYPQTVVEDSDLITELTWMASDIDSDGYLEYRNAEYKESTGAPHNSDYKSVSGNVTFVKGTTYYFKVEPIQWRVLSGKGTKTGLVMSEKILADSAYYTSTSNRTVSGSTVYANNYQYSTLRAMLNGYDGSAYSVGNFAGKGFLDVAFTEAEKAHIMTTTVDNSVATTESSSNSYACANTDDRIFALSYQDLINTSYGFNSSYSAYDTARRGALTDYARATGAYMSTNTSYYGNGYWWSRSPSAEYFRTVWDVSYEGSLYYDYYHASSALSGVRPSFTVNIG